MAKYKIVQKRKKWYKHHVNKKHIKTPDMRKVSHNPPRSVKINKDLVYHSLLGYFNLRKAECCRQKEPYNICPSEYTHAMPEAPRHHAPS